MAGGEWLVASDGWEGGLGDPRISRIPRIMRVVGVSPGKFMVGLGTTRHDWVGLGLTGWPAAVASGQWLVAGDDQAGEPPGGPRRPDPSAPAGQNPCAVSKAAPAAGRLMPNAYVMLPYSSTFTPLVQSVHPVQGGQPPGAAARGCSIALTKDRGKLPWGLALR